MNTEIGIATRPYKALKSFVAYTATVTARPTDPDRIASIVFRCITANPFVSNTN